MTTPTDTDTLRLRVRVDAPPGSVYKALTDPEAMTEWLAESAEVALDDGRYEFWGRYTPSGDRPRQRLGGVEPERGLRFTWALDGAPESTVDIALPADGDATVVTVTHAGVPRAAAHTLDCFWHVTLANLVAHCEGFPTMPPFDFSAPAQGAALVRIVVDVPAEQVYASLLDPAQVDKWAGGKAVIRPEVGGGYDLGWDHGPSTILELEPDKVLGYSWRDPGHPDTVVRWQLRQARGSTYLTLIHSGFTDDALAERYRQRWPGLLVEIKRMLELGPAWQPLTVS